MPSGDRLFLAALSKDGAPGVELHLLARETQQTFSIPPAGDKSAIRFAVGEPGRRSTIWRLWAPPNMDDVYLGSRRSTNIFKVSLHESGDYRMQWVAKDRTGAFFAGRNLEGSRIMHQWQRPEPVVTGMSEALGLWVPTADVAEVPGDSEKYLDVQWLPPAPLGGAVQFRIVLIRPEAAFYDVTSLVAWGVFSYVNGFRLAGGQVVVLLAITSVLTTSQAKHLDEVRAYALRDIPSDFDRTPSLGPRFAVIDVEPEGVRMLWDLAVPAAAAAHTPAETA